MELDAAYLEQKLSQLPPLSHYYVAFSGGVDSHVLLYLLSQLSNQQPSLQITAVHVNHGLQSQSNDWAEHCQQTCDDLNIPILVKKVSVDLDNGQSPEAAARDARYAVFRELVEEGCGLLMAHHEDDQAETVLLQLFRGAGVAGLSAMPGAMEFEKGWLLRPLLDVSRVQIEAFACQHGLKWVEDPSNTETSFDRNFLRHEIIPKLTSRWPALNTSLSRAASHQAEAASLLKQLAVQDYAGCHGRIVKTLSVSALLVLDLARQKNLLRYWIKTICGLRLPDSRHMQRILTEVLTATANANPLVQWGNVQVRRYRDDLYAISASEIGNMQELAEIKNWQVDKPLLLADGTKLRAERVKGKGLKLSLLESGKLLVGYRQGGEQCVPVGRGHHHSVKKLMQEWGIPPWQRDHIPFIFVDDELAQVVGHCVCEPFQAMPDEIGLFISQTGV